MAIKKESEPLGKEEYRVWRLSRDGNGIGYVLVGFFETLPLEPRFWQSKSRIDPGGRPYITMTEIWDDPTEFGADELVFNYSDEISALENGRFFSSYRTWLDAHEVVGDERDRLLREWS